MSLTAERAVEDFRGLQDLEHVDDDTVEDIDGTILITKKAIEAAEEG